MRLRHITAIAFCAMAIISCDEDTATIGGSLTSENDKLTVSTHNFDVLTRSVAVDSVFSRERQCFIGKVKDPETNTYVKSEFTAQFNMMENTVSDMPLKSQMISTTDDQILADSCVIYVHFDQSATYGDTLAAMKMKVSELDRPISDVKMHYSNYDPKSEGFIREDGLKQQVMFSVTDLSMSVSNPYRWARIHLSAPYTDKAGRQYNNYGTYLMTQLYEHPEYFKNSFTFVRNVCPGFFFELTDGIGVMAKIAQIDMYTYYHFIKNDTTYYSYLRTTSTEEVVQTIKVTNNKDAINKLVKDNSCTYLKTPAGIFTEVTLPVDEICQSHTSDSLLSAKVSFLRINNQNDASSYALSIPSKVLLIEKDSVNSFFEGNSLHNNTYAFKTSLETNAYTFGDNANNISNLITRMYNEKEKGLKSDPNWVANHPNWNKALLVPIEEITLTTNDNTSSYSYYYYGTSNSTPTIIGLVNQMGLSSTRLVRGTADNPLKMEVIYARFNK